MGERTAYAPGSFCWVDLGTSDPEGARRFYGELLGWELEDHPEYAMFRRGGYDVAAAQVLGEGEPARWSSYLSVVDAEATAERVNELGGTRSEEHTSELQSRPYLVCRL